MGLGGKRFSGFGGAARLLIAALLLALPAAAEGWPRPHGWAVSVQRAVYGGEHLLVHGRRVATNQHFQRGEVFWLGGQELLLVNGSSGGAYCCDTTHLFRRHAGRSFLVGSFYRGKGGRPAPAVEGDVLWMPDPAFDFWDLNVSLSNDLMPAMALRLSAGRLVPDPAAMRVPQAQALGDACLRRGNGLMNSNYLPPSFATLEEAVAELPRGEWDRDPRRQENWRPEAEIPRRALCLLFAGHGRAALLMMEAWPRDRPDRALALRQLRARLLCEGPWLSTLRVLNGPGHPWLSGMEEARDISAFADMGQEREWPP